MLSGRVPELAAGVELRPPCESLMGSSPIMPTSLNGIVCPECGGVKTRPAPRCRVCTQKKNRKVERPSIDELNRMLGEMPVVAIAKKYGVSNTAVKKWMRR